MAAKKGILATGIEDVHPKIDNLFELRKLGLLRYCSICDAYEYRDQLVSVLAEDDAGIQKAVFIRQWTRNFRIILPKHLTLAPQRAVEIRKLNIKVSRCQMMKIEPCFQP